MLRIPLQWPAADPLSKNILDFKAAVESRTKGVIVQVDDKGRASGRGQTLLGAVRDGSAEISAVPLAEISKEVPASLLLSLPFMFNFDAIVQAAVHSGSEIRTLLDQQIEKAGYHVLWWQPYGSTVLFSKANPIVNPNGLSDHKVGVLDDQAAEFIRMCGGIPQLMKDTELLAALEGKTIDATLLSISEVRTVALWNKMNKINNIGYSNSLFAVLMSDKAWRSLSHEQQILIVEAAHVAEESIWDGFAASEAEAYDLALKKGMTIETTTADDTLAWRTCSSPVLETFLSKSELLGARLLAAYGKLRSDPCCSQALQTSTGD